MAIFNSYVSHYQRVYSNHKPAATRKMLEIHLLLVERPVALWTAHEPPYSFAPQISSFFYLESPSIWPNINGEKPGIPTVYPHDHVLVVDFSRSREKLGISWGYPQRWDAFPLSPGNPSWLHAMPWLLCGGFIMPIFWDFRIWFSWNQQCKKKNTFSPSTSTRYFRSCSDVLTVRAMSQNHVQRCCEIAWTIQFTSNLWEKPSTRWSPQNDR